jgi:hypothetical protein
MLLLRAAFGRHDLARVDLLLSSAGSVRPPGHCRIILGSLAQPWCRTESRSRAHSSSARSIAVSRLVSHGANDAAEPARTNAAQCTAVSAWSARLCAVCTHTETRARRVGSGSWMSWHGICGALIKLPVTSNPQESLSRLLPRLPQGSLLVLAMRTLSWGTCPTELPTSSFHWRVIIKPTLSIHFIFSTCAALDSPNSPPRLRRVALVPSRALSGTG